VSFRYLFRYGKERFSMMVGGQSPLQDLFDVSGAAELVSPDVTLSATALHHGANDWSRALRRAGITRGDRVICALPNGPAFVQLLIACLADGVTLAPVGRGELLEPLLDQLDARVAIAEHEIGTYISVPSRTGGPPSAPLRPRASSIRTDGIAFLMRSSGTAAEPRWIGLSETGILAVLDSHLPHLDVDGAKVLSILPWSHAFGLVIGLIPALLRARRIVTTAGSKHDPAQLLQLAGAAGVTYMDMVPLTAARLAATQTGLTYLRGLHGGVIGGAPVDAGLAERLASTRLRIGYGQTEASPGIMLGQPGEFRAGILGRPVGCEVRIDADRVLAYRGPNVSPGVWEGRAFVALDPDRWQRSDDLVSVENGVYIFHGRATSTFKLANGKVVEAPMIERLLRQRLPRLTEVLLTTRDGVALDIVYSTADSLPVDAESVHALLGGLRAYLGTTRCVSPDAWLRTPKGEIDRRRPPF
jgi:long-subunit acyl-CoA synthetase (AMP-forming)